MTKKTKSLAKASAVFAVLVLCIYGIHALGFDAYFSTQWVDEHVRHRGLWGSMLFLAMGAGFTAIGLPRQIVSFLAGYVFGVTLGTFWGVLATVLGCALSFGFARVLGRAVIFRRYGKKHGERIARLNAFIARNPFSMVIVIRCLPVGNNLLTNLAAGISSISACSFLGASALGYLPQTCIFALLGSGVRIDPLWRTLVSAVLFVLSSALGWYLYKRYKVEKNLDKESVQ